MSKEKTNKELVKEEKGKELSLDELEQVAGGSLRDTVKTETSDITESIKDRV